MKLESGAWNVLSSYRTTIVLLVIYAFGLGLATFVEKMMSTEAAKILIYYSPLFFILQFLLVFNFVLILIRRQLYKKKNWGGLAVHFSLIIILAGALVTHIWGEEGSIHIREGEKTDRMLVQTNKGDSFRELPFSIELKKFTLVRYPGSSSPSSYESDLVINYDGQTIAKKISMNNVFDIKGYRLFQASFDTDEHGTILSVNKDVAGRNVTYTGYVLLVIGFILCFVAKKSRFRQLAGQLQELRNTTKITSLSVIFALFSFSATAQNNTMHNSNVLDVVQKNKVDAQHAALFGSLPMQSIDGRMEPINTFSSEVLRKLHQSEKIGELNSDQFLLSLLTIPDMWMHVPLIKLKNKNIAFNFDLTEGYCTYIEMFDSNGHYKLQSDLENAFNKSPSARSKYDKDLIKLDEQINIFHQLVNKKMLNIFPKEGDVNHKWYAYGDDLSDFETKDSLFIVYAMDEYLGCVREALRAGEWGLSGVSLDAIRKFQITKNNSLDVSAEKIEGELLYNKLNIFRVCKILYLNLGGLLLIFSFISLFKTRKWISWISRILIVAVSLSVLYHLFGIGVRWYIAGYAPWSNSYETMVYVSFITVMAGLFFVRQSSITMALATLFGGIILFVSGLNWMDPQISPLVPVLKSPWLMIHVAINVAAYGFFGISFLLGLTNLSLLSINRKRKYVILTNRIKELTIVNEMSLWAGLALMTIGAFLGAVWANESWGRYWGWDPKETWALVTIVVYAIVTHLRLVKKWDNPYLFNLLAALAFASVLMTYFGVNYLLSGMHSYG